MNSPSIKHLNFRSIPTVLAIGFALLVFLICWIGVRSSSKLNEISLNAREGTDEYMDRLRLALNIQESVTEVVAEARVYRIRQLLRFPGPPFVRRFNEAKSRFLRRFEEGKKQWRSVKDHETLTQEELAAWDDVEKASQEFLGILAKFEEETNKEKAKEKSSGEEKLVNNSERSPESEQTLSDQVQSDEAQPDQIDLFKLRGNLDKSAKKLTDAVTKVRNEILGRIVIQQERAAKEINRTTVITLALGLLVATLTLIFARKQIIQIRKANQQEQEAKDFARSIFDSQSNDIIVVNNAGGLLAVNQVFLNHFKLGPSLVSQDYRVALDHLPEVAAFVGKALAQPDDSSVLRERIEVGAQYANNGKDAETRLFDVYASPLTIGGQPGGRVVVIVDVTEAEKVREELRRTRALSAVGQITATVAHELYNPIGAVKLNLDLLEMQISGDGELTQTVGRLRRGVEHLSTIVMDLRHLTRTRDPEPQTTDMNKLLDEVVELASDRLQRSRIRIDRNYSTQLPAGEYDPQQLRKVFLNLLINAVEASPQNSGVELRTHYVSGNGAPAPAKSNGAEGALVVSVVDRGVGMTAETRRRLFEAFYTTKRNGTGLGMMITREIVKKHGGKIEVESEEGKGTTVSVYLPV
jgi:signal transduction histidine kinase